MTQNIKAVLWDVDGTLVDSEPVHDLTIEQGALSLGVKLPSHFHNELLGKSDTETFAWIRDYVGGVLPIDYENWTKLREDSYAQLMHKVTPFEDIFSIWKALQNASVPQGVVSNSLAPIVEINLDILGQNIPETIRVTRNDVSHGKPHPEPYLMGAQKLGFAPEEVAAVEDSEAGATSAERAGLKVFVVPWFSGDKNKYNPVENLAGEFNITAKA